MNRKLLLVAVLVLIVAAGYYLFRSSSKAESPKPAEIETTAPNTENVSVELSLKTSSSATEDTQVKVDLPAGSDHCEVLKKALEQGKIKGLDMRYQEEYKTNGVFVINGIGKSDSPWWVYKINGADAPLGCSEIKVAQGDKILWEYLGE